MTALVLTLLLAGPVASGEAAGWESVKGNDRIWQGLEDLWRWAQGVVAFEMADAGISVDPDGATADSDKGSSIDPNGATADSDKGIAIDPDGATTNSEAGHLVDPNG